MGSPALWSLTRPLGPKGGAIFRLPYQNLDIDPAGRFTRYQHTTFHVQTSQCGCRLPNAQPTDMKAQQNDSDISPRLHEAIGRPSTLSIPRGRHDPAANVPRTCGSPNRELWAKLGDQSHTRTREPGSLVRNSGPGIPSSQGCELSAMMSRCCERAERSIVGSGARFESQNEGSKERWRIASLLGGQSLKTNSLFEV